MLDKNIQAMATVGGAIASTEFQAVFASLIDDAESERRMITIPINQAIPGRPAGMIQYRFAGGETAWLTSDVPGFNDLAALCTGLT